MAEQTISITGVDFVALPAPAAVFDATVAFYEDVLGLPRRKQWGDMPGVEFQVGNLTLAIMDPAAFGIEHRPHATPFAFQVADVAVARAALEAAGVALAADTIDSGVCHMAPFPDPAGNMLMLHHRYDPTGA